MVIKLFENFYTPPLEITNRLKNIVNKLEEKYHGGRAFFDALDSHIKDIVNVDMIIHLVAGNENNWIASSGEFGDNLYRLWKEGKFKCRGVVVFNGKMQTNKVGVRGWYPDDFEISGKKYLYVDDSYFSGSTVKKINDFLNQHNSTIKSVSVIYDGSKEKKSYVNSYFRYYK